MERTCAVCGTVLEEGASFCPTCGTAVPETGTNDGISEAQANQVNSSDSSEVQANQVNSVDSSAANRNMQSGNVPNGNIPSGNMPNNNLPNNNIPDGNIPNSDMYQANTWQQAPSNPGWQNGYYSAPASMYPDGANGMEPEKKDPKGLGVAALVLGIIGLLFSCCGGGLLLGLIALILGIIYAVKSKKKGLGIAGIILGALSLLISGILVVMVFMAPAGIISALDDMGIDTDDLEQYLNDGSNDAYEIDDSYNWNEIKDILDDMSTGSPAVQSTEDWGDDGRAIPEDILTPPDTQETYDNATELTAMNQIRIADRIYTFPCRLNEGIYVVNDYADDYMESGEVIEGIASSGLESHDYNFVMLRDDYGNYFYGYIQNPTLETVYSLDELEVSGVNVDTYSLEDVPEVETYGGISLYMNRSAVETLLGTPYFEEEDHCVYLSDDESAYIEIWFANDLVEEIEVNYFYEWERD